MTSAPSSTVTGLLSGPGPIALSRFWRALASPRHAAPHSPCIIRSKRSISWSRRCARRARCSLEVGAEMIEKTQNNEAEPDEPGEIKACVGATGGGEGTVSAIPPEELDRLKTDLV